MRDYGKVYSAFWASEEVRAMTEDGRVLALYLMTSPHGNMLGCFRLPNAYAADDLQWSFERVSIGFVELSRNGFATRCERSFWVVIHKHLKWNRLDNENMGKAAAKLYESLAAPDSIKAMLSKALREFGTNFPAKNLAEIDATLEGYRNGIETVSKPVAVAVAVTGAGDPAPAGAPAPGAAEDKKSPVKKNPPKPQQEAQAILTYLNDQARRNYKPVKANLSLIGACLSEATADECRAVIDLKVKAWLDDPKMQEYLRPATLFGAKNFANYVGQLQVSAPAKKDWT